MGWGKDPVRAERRATAQAAIDTYWNPGTLGWTVDWQRHYVYLAQLLDEGTSLKAITPGVTWHGEDIGRWLATQRRDFRRLTEQQRRLAELGVKPARAVRARTAAAEPGTTTTTGRGAAAHKGVQALTQYIAREGGSLPGRAHVEHLPDGTEHRTGVWIVNQKQRRERLGQDQLAALAALGVQ
ncbi:helicase associated domain-containing protein [Streptomyces sp. NPDC090077]|uniref:helicase associated domain-containing protein n=1 Tax=Streptomyces sp. NPDC090077 TaxID=3365938 RepID=UPI00382EB3A2